MRGAANIVQSTQHLHQCRTPPKSPKGLRRDREAHRHSQTVVRAVRVLPNNPCDFDQQGRGHRGYCRQVRRRASTRRGRNLPRMGRSDADGGTSKRPADRHETCPRAAALETSHCDEVCGLGQSLVQHCGSVGDSFYLPSPRPSPRGRGGRANRASAIRSWRSTRGELHRARRPAAACGRWPRLRPRGNRRSRRRRHGPGSPDRSPAGPCSAP